GPSKRDDGRSASTAAGTSRILVPMGWPEDWPTPYGNSCTDEPEPVRLDRESTMDRPRRGPARDRVGTAAEQPIRPARRCSDIGELASFCAGQLMLVASSHVRGCVNRGTADTTADRAAAAGVAGDTVFYVQPLPRPAPDRRRETTPR